jgi:glycosyltransferase involved in cell wall biosynthesis
MSMNISVVIITYNEEDRLEAALKSVDGVADEIVVVDRFSSDDTAKIAEKYTDRFIQREWTNYADQKNFANAQATHPWILSLDADERLSSQLREEIISLKSGDQTDAHAFSMPRQAYYLGRWIRHSGWYPDRKTRLFRKDSARWEGAFVHERLEVEGPVSKLKGVLQHFTYRSLSDHVQRLDTYSSLGAQRLYAEQKRCRWHHLRVLPIFGFLRAYVWKAGFLDGAAGFIIAVMQGYGVFVRYAKLREIWKKGERIEPFPN